jgi:hypothetical protein
MVRRNLIDKYNNLKEININLSNKVTPTVSFSSHEVS